MDNSESQSNVEQLDLLRSWVEKRDEQDLHRARLKAVGPEGFDEAVAIVAEWLNATVPTPQPIAEDLIDGMMHLDAYLPSEYTEIDIKLLIEKAKIDFYAYQVLRYVDQIDQTARQFEAMKTWRTSHYLKTLVPPKRPPGPRRLGYYFRDGAFVSTIAALIDAGFIATRNRSPDGESVKACRSACDVVSKAWGRNIDYAAVETVWNKRQKQLTAKSTANTFVEGLARALSEKIDPD